MNLKMIFTTAVLAIALDAGAQKIEKIFVNLYTDSLKKGTYNYINIDGQLSNGSYLPLDTNHLTFWASEGKFSGNNLWIEKEPKYDRVLIRVTLRSNPQLNEDFTLHVKKMPDNEKLKTEEELLNEMKKGRKKR